VRADLVAGADGRHSTVRELAALPRRDLGAPIDVLWMRLPRRPDDGEQVLGTLAPGRFLVMLNRGDYWQCAYLIEKGGRDRLEQRGLPALREGLAALVPFLRDRVDLLTRWDDIKLLTVVVDRLERWWAPGVLCIGDAAHAMSPIGGVGINLAIQDRVLAGALAGRPGAGLRIMRLALRYLPPLRRAIARAIAVGQLEHFTADRPTAGASHAAAASP
ncbi:MAG TPA: FAD-dependent monooxygenase, partial [Kofleriaceae bacterium]|nr:FAD-dependent monooxygenase [Kofleriaceae bacterium]